MSHTNPSLWNLNFSLVSSKDIYYLFRTGGESQDLSGMKKWVARNEYFFTYLGKEILLFRQNMLVQLFWFLGILQLRNCWLADPI